MNWEQYFMGVATLSENRSKDPNTKVGACIVNSKNRIVGVGYNGMPKGLDNIFTWEREGEETKYKYVVHAELNAVLNTDRGLDDCRIYTSLFPCSECAKVIVQSGIKEVIYLDDKYKDTDDNRASKHILNSCGVLFRQFED